MSRRRIVIAALVCVAIVVLGVLRVVTSGEEAAPGYTEETVLTAGTREADGTPVTLDGLLYLPERTPAPAVLLAHGYGGDKDSMAADARALVRRGFVVLTYSARGFGDSGGKIHLDSRDYEVKDAQRMLDVLGRRSEVRKDGAGDPRVGVAGPSYGGALALLLAGTDPRVDAIAPSITWNDLQQALFPQFATASGTATAGTPAGFTPVPTPGVFKKQWTAVLLGQSAAAGPARPTLPTPTGTAPTPEELSFQTLDSACGNVEVQLCFGYLQAATTGRPTPELLKLLADSSPSRVASRIRVPTLLIQGQTDSLFPLSEADANARAIAANGAPVQMVWEGGGHDAGADDSDRPLDLTGDFFTRVLGRPAGQPAPTADLPGFSVTALDAVLSTSNSDPAPEFRSAPRYPGLAGGSGAGSGDPVRTTDLRLTGDEQLALSPPGAAPAALTSLPGASGALSALDTAGAAASGFGSSSSPEAEGGSTGLAANALPGQVATFETGPLATGTTITGSSKVRVRITSTAVDTTLFASLVDVAPDGATTLPQRLVSPVFLQGKAGVARDVQITLPAIVHDVPAGHRLRVVLSSTDQGYSLPPDARGYRIQLTSPELTVPQVPLTVDGDDATRGLVVAALLLALFTALLVLAFWLRNRAVRRRTAFDVDEDLTGIPLSIDGLGKAYGDGFRAVSDLSFRVEKGEVLGLLGPNGAGKTTTLRMLMGLILPTEGEIRIFGHQVSPGAAVLSRLGSFIEGPGFLPHLTGLENLTLYWRSTGRRDADSGLELALEIAGLGDDVNRKVRTYSQGMRQRLAIAQAMLGLPDLLVLDEPTNGLDPPQIREMREVLRRYAATGRTVIVSSHLLAEVEQTCTHVVVMLGGRLVASGTVDDLIGQSSATVIDVDDPAGAARIAGLVKGMSEVTVTDTGLLVKGSPATRALLVRSLVLADIRVDRVAPQRGLEETFLALVGEN